MHKNRAWLIFLAFIGIATLYFCIYALIALYNYHYETHTTVPLSLEWSYRELSNDTYAPVVTYTFQVEGKTYHGENLLKEPLFRNEWVADDILNELSRLPQKIWYDPANPQRSSIEKRFPTREVLSAVVLVALFSYFIGLGIYVRKRFHTEDM